MSQEFLEDRKRSLEEAFFAKQNQDKYDVWKILYEEQGKEKV